MDQLRLGDVGHDVVLKLAGGFEIGAAAVRALFGVHVVFDECRLGRRLGAKNARVPAMLLAAAVVGRALPGRTLALGAFAALEKLLDLMLQSRNPPPELGVLGLQFGNPLIAWVIHDQRSLPKNAKMGKSSCLTVTFREWIEKLDIEAESIRAELRRRDRERTEPPWEMKGRLVKYAAKFAGLRAFVRGERA